MVSALDSGARGPGSRPGRGHCVVFLGKTLNIKEYRPYEYLGANPAMD